MNQAEILYDYTPPSILKNDKTFIPAKVNRFVSFAFYHIFEHMIKNNFASIRMKNLRYYNLRDKNKANIFYAPHQCWWDGPVGYYLSQKVFKTNIRIMVEDLSSFPILSGIGCFSVSKSNPSLAVKSLKYVISFLKEQTGSLWIFPQGMIKPPDFRPVSFASGMSYIAQQMEGINLFPLSFRYEFLRCEKPEILVELGKPILLKKAVKDRKKFNSFLEKNFEENLNSQKEDISLGKLDNYVKILERHEPILRRIEKKLKSYDKWRA